MSHRSQHDSDHPDARPASTNRRAARALLGLAIALGAGIPAATAAGTDLEEAIDLARHPKQAHTFTLGETRFEISLPSVCRVSPSAGIRIDCPPNTRSPSTIYLDAVGSATPPVPPEHETRDFGWDHSLVYWIDEEGGGSGGPESHLYGRLRVGNEDLAVVCTTQGELSRPPATWCIPYLRSIRVVDE